MPHPVFHPGLPDWFPDSIATALADEDVSVVSAKFGYSRIGACHALLLILDIPGFMANWSKDEERPAAIVAKTFGCGLGGMWVNDYVPKREGYPPREWDHGTDRDRLRSRYTCHVGIPVESLPRDLAKLGVKAALGESNNWPEDGKIKFDGVHIASSESHGKKTRYYHVALSGLVNDWVPEPCDRPLGSAAAPTKRLAENNFAIGCIKWATEQFGGKWYGTAQGVVGDSSKLICAVTATQVPDLEPEAKVRLLKLAANAALGEAKLAVVGPEFDELSNLLSGGGFSLDEISLDSINGKWPRPDDPDGPAGRSYWGVFFRFSRPRQGWSLKAVLRPAAAQGVPAQLVSTALGIGLDKVGSWNSDGHGRSITVVVERAHLPEAWRRRLDRYRVKRSLGESDQDHFPLDPAEFSRLEAALAEQGAVLQSAGVLNDKLRPVFKVAYTPVRKQLPDGGWGIRGGVDTRALQKLFGIDLGPRRSGHPDKGVAGASGPSANGTWTFYFWVADMTGEWAKVAGKTLVKHGLGESHGGDAFDLDPGDFERLKQAVSERVTLTEAYVMVRWLGRPMRVPELRLRYEPVDKEDWYQSKWLLDKLCGDDEEIKHTAGLVSRPDESGRYFSAFAVDCLLPEWLKMASKGIVKSRLG